MNKAHANFAPASHPARTKRRQPLVTWMASALALAAVGVSVWFFWSAGMFASGKRDGSGLNVEMADKRTIVVRDSSIKGLDEENLPFFLKARLSRHYESDKNLVHLEEVAGELQKKNGEKIVYRADHGTYRRKEKIVDLKGNVRISSEGRYVLVMDSAQVDTRSKELRSTSPTVMRLTDGVIRSGAFRTARGAGSIVFSGGVHAVFGTDEDAAGGKPADAANGGKGAADGKATADR